MAAMGKFDLLQPVIGGSAEARVDKIAPDASLSQPATGLAAAMRSDQAPPFGKMAGGRLFGMSSTSLQADMLNQLVRALSAAAISALAGGALARLLAPAQSQSTPDQATCWVGSAGRDARQDERPHHSGVTADARAIGSACADRPYAACSGRDKLDPRTNALETRSAIWPLENKCAM